MHTRVCFALLAAGFGFMGCGNPPDSMGQPDLAGFIQTGCTSSADCDDSNPCTNDICTSATKECAHPAKDCSTAATDCNTGVCNVTTGACEPEAANENMTCTTTNGDPGACKVGTCTALPTCVVDNFWFCGDTWTGDTSTFTGGLDTYTCGSGFTGNEVAYTFYPDAGGLTTVTMTSTVDLDLLVIEGDSCNSSAACSGQGVTVGTGNETVTFMADPTKNYVVVVESKDPSIKGSFHLAIDCAKTCTAVPGKTLACNMTVAGNTTTGTNATSVTICTSNVALASGDTGPENVYTLNVSDDTDFVVKLTGLSQDLDLQVMSSIDGTNCDGSCVSAPAGFNTGTTSESVAFTAYSGQPYFVVVDSKTTGGAYQLEVSCPFNCSKNTGAISCDQQAVGGFNDGPNATTLVDSWACSAGTTGPETIYYFSPDTTGSYTFDLTWLNAAASLDLLLMNGTTLTCDASQACTAPATGTGTKRTISSTLTAGKEYYLIVDSKSTVSTGFNIRLTSSQCGAANCDQRSQNTNLSCNYREESRRTDDSNHAVNLIDAWGPVAGRCIANTTGSEVVYQFHPVDTGNYTVSLTGVEAGKTLALVVTEGVDAATCDASSACLQSASSNATTHDASVTFAASTSKYYYIAVDGVNGDTSKYNIALSGTKTAGGNACASAFCKSAPTTLTCTTTGRNISSRNDGPGATSAVTTWGTTTSCATGENAPEMAHLFIPTKTASYTFQLIGTTADLDIIVMEADSTGACDGTAATCVGAGTTVSTSTESVTVTLTKNKTYYIIVDGKNGGISNYTLSITNGC